MTDMSDTSLRKLLEELIRVKIRLTGNDAAAAKTLNAVIDAIEHTQQQERPFARRLAMLLDASIPALEKAAEAEHRREKGKYLRCITDHERLKAVKEAVAKADELFGSIS
jgi:hypothetical protein